MRRVSLACLVLSGALAALIAPACRSEAPAYVLYAAGGSAGEPDDAAPSEEAGDDALDAAPRPATMLGARCKGDGDCEAGLFCSVPLSTDWIGGGPAHGYCTKDCSQDGDVACTAVDLQSFCHGPVDGVRLCIKSCEPAGASSELDFDIMKCWARQDVACTPFAFEGTASGRWGCWPTCGDDTDCPGIPCDGNTGLCTPGSGGGLPLGSNCSEWSGSQGDAGQRCEGYCTNWTRSEDAGAADAGSEIRTCLARCVIGDPNACGFPKGLCMSEAEAGASFGDLGYCVQTCESDEDCLDKQSGVFCDEEAVPGVGVCNWYAHGTAPDAG